MYLYAVPTTDQRVTSKCDLPQCRLCRKQPTQPVSSLINMLNYSVSQKIPPPSGFWHFSPKRLGIFNQFLHTYYTFLCTLDYKFLFNYFQLRRSYAMLSATTKRLFLDFTRTLTFKLVYWANDVTVDVMSYPTCLLTLQKCLFYSDLPQTTIKNLLTIYANVWTRAFRPIGGHFEHIVWTR